MIGYRGDMNGLISIIAENKHNTYIWFSVHNIKAYFTSFMVSKTVIFSCTINLRLLSVYYSNYKAYLDKTAIKIHKLT